MPSTPMRCTLPKLSLISVSCGRRLQSQRAAPPRSTSNVERLAGAGADDALHVGEALDRAAVDRDDRSPGLKPAASAALPGLHRIDARGRRLLAVDVKTPAKIDDREDEIGDRPGRDDRGALARPA